MNRITDYTIVNGVDTKMMVEDAFEKLLDGWQPLGGCMPNNYTEYGFNRDAGEREPYAYTTYTQTWVKREA